MGQTKAQLGKTPTHVRIFARQMHSAAWLHLSGSAVKVLLTLASLEKGDNNGEIYLSERKGAEFTGLTRNTVLRALNELIETGFIYRSQRGGFSRKTPHAACYGITWQAGPKGTPWRAPSHAYEQWSDEKTRAQILTETGPVSDIDMETPPFAGPYIAPVETETRLVSANHHMSGIGPHTSNQGVGSAGEETGHWKQPSSSRPFLAELRASLITRLDQSEPGEQNRLAASARIPRGTLSKFKVGSNLPDHHAAALARELMAAIPNPDLAPTIARSSPPSSPSAATRARRSILSLKGA